MMIGKSSVVATNAKILEIIVNMAWGIVKHYSETLELPVLKEPRSEVVLDHVHLHLLLFHGKRNFDAHPDTFPFLLFGFLIGKRTGVLAESIIRWCVCRELCQYRSLSFLR